MITINKIHEKTHSKPYQNAFVLIIVQNTITEGLFLNLV